MIRGSRSSLDPKGAEATLTPKAAAPTVFKHVVGDAGWQESWVEGLEVYLNPNALIPFDETLIPRGATPAATRRELDRARCFAPSPPDQVENLP